MAELYSANMTDGELQKAIEQWRRGVPFSHAWFEFGDPYAVAKYREANSLQVSVAQQILMVADLWEGLNSGAFRALGKCVAPVISDGPIPIPTHTFEFRPPFGIENCDDFEISGWRYEGVKVVRSDTTEAGPELIAAASRDPGVRGRGGRPDTYPFSSRVLEVLYRTESNRFLSAAKLHAKFSAEFERQFPRDQFQLAPPSPRTLQDQIKRFQQESAETGNN